MPQFSIQITIPELQSFAGASARTFPNLAHAVTMVAAAVQRQWQAYARGEPLPNGTVIRSRSGAYLRSIMIRPETDFRTVVESGLAYAEAIEKGSPQRDLHRILSSSLRVRVSKKGLRYLIIPFRWGTPGTVTMGHSMPQAVHDWWQAGRTPSVVTGLFRRPSGTGAYDIATRELVTVPAWRYRWGDRLGTADLHAMGASAQQTKRMAGMVNFRKPAAVGGKAHSQYVTFRTMVEGSPGWISPAQPGKWPAKLTAEKLTPTAEQVIRAAAEADIQAQLREGR